MKAGSIEWQLADLSSWPKTKKVVDKYYSHFATRRVCFGTTKQHPLLSTDIVGYGSSVQARIGLTNTKSVLAFLLD